MKRYFYILILIMAASAGFIYLHFQTPKQNKITPPVVSPTQQKTQTVTPTIANTTCEALKVTTPLTGKITSSLKLTVTVDNTKNCHWTVFEAQAGTVEIKDNNGTILGQGVLRTSEEWAVPTPVTYNSTITFKKATTATGLLIITEENPSGKPNAQKRSLPISFAHDPES